MHATRRRIGSSAWLGLGLVVALPNLAQAQLFPNRTINRQRADCATEPPFYSQVRKNYFGYYPTCWSRFPAGWGCPCPNPELPNTPAAFAAQPRDKMVPLENEEGEGMGDDLAPPLSAPPAGDTGIPPVPNGGRSPFNAELSPPDGAARPPVDPALPPQSSRTPASGNRAKPTALGLPEVNPSTSGLLEMPKVNLPGEAPVEAKPAVEPALSVGGVIVVPDATLTSGEATVRPVAPAPAPAGLLPVGPDVIDAALPPGPPTASAPAQAPQRKGILSSLIGKRRR